MNVARTIQMLVYAHDLRLIGHQTALPRDIKTFKLKQSTIDRYLTSFAERVTFLAWDFLYLEFVKENPNGTKEEFNRKFFGTFQGHEKYREALAAVSKLLPAEVTLDALQKVQQEAPELTSELANAK